MSHEVKDKWISIALLSPSIILAVQFFILSMLNIENTVLQSNIQFISKILVFIIYLTSIAIIYKRSSKMMLISIYVFLLIFIITFIIYPDNRKYLSTLSFNFFSMGLVPLIYSYSIKKWSVFYKVLIKVSHIIFAILIVLSVFILLGHVNINTYSMTLSYYLLLPTIVYINETMDKLTLKYSTLSSMAILIILLFGSRGAIFCVLLFIILKLIVSVKNLNRKNLVFYNALSILFIIVVFNYENILFKIKNGLSSIGLYSRSLDLLTTNISYSSGRDSLYNIALTNIINNPLVGLGIGADRVIFNGDSVHNIFLEIFLNFGILISILIISVFVILILKILRSNMFEKNIIVIWIAVGFGPLIFSSSYWIDTEFWILIGIILNLTVKRILKRKNHYEI